MLRLLSLAPRAVLAMLVCYTVVGGEVSPDAVQDPAVPKSLPIGSEAYCGVTGQALGFMSLSTRRMAGVLEQITRSADPRLNPFLNRARAELLKIELESAVDPQKRLQLGTSLSRELLNAGETQSALERLDKLDQIAQTHSLTSRSLSAEWRMLRALAHLRLGEQQNCLSNHQAQSCIFPIEAGGVHLAQAGSLKAISLLQEQLTLFGRDRTAAWLLNIAYMTLGEHPDQVPRQWVIPPRVFASGYPMKRFPDIASELGLDTDDLAGGTVAEDFDNDGHLDLLISDWSLRGPMHFFRNRGDGSFVDRTAEAGLAGLVGGLNMISGDYNNDGLVDVFILRGGWMGRGGMYPDSLVRNDGGGHFTDVTEEAGLMISQPNQTAVWLDYNADGWLDLFVGYESDGDRVYPCRLYRNNQNGTFTECGAESGVAVVGFVKGVIAGDINNDGRPDLYLSLQGKDNILLRNEGPSSPNKSAAWKFADISVSAGVTEPLTSFPAFFFDYDNDGWEDLFVGGYRIKDVGDVASDYMGLSNTAERPRLYRNKGDGSFEDVTKRMNLFHVIQAMGVNFGDLDNDGYLDIYLGTGDPNLINLSPNRMFRNDGGTNFQDVTTSGGFGHLQKGHAISFADFDNDGDQDIYESIGGAMEGDHYQNVLFENPGHTNHWITLKLEGMDSNKAAIGARIRVQVETQGTLKTFHRTVGTGGSFGCNPLRQEIGLGQAERVRQVEIFWPRTGRTQSLTHLMLDRFYHVREGAAEAEDLHLLPTPFRKGVLSKHPHRASESSPIR